MNIWNIIAAWIKHLFYLHNSGIDVPTPPEPGGSPVVIPPGPAAVSVASTPALDSVSVAAPAAIASRYPYIDADGTIKPYTFAGTPLANYRCMIQDTYEQPGLPDAIKANLLSNFDENFGQRIQGNTSDPFDLTGITEGHNYLVPRMQPSNNPPSYGDVLVFPAKNTVNNWPGFRLADCEAFVAHCQATGKWPRIDHTGIGAVA